MAKRIRFIKKAEALGFALDEIRILFPVEGADCCADARNPSARKPALIERKLADFKAMLQALGTLLHPCGRSGSKAAGPIVRPIAGDQ